MTGVSISTHTSLMQAVLKGNENCQAAVTVQARHEATLLRVDAITGELNPKWTIWCYQCQLLPKTELLGGT